MAKREVGRRQRRVDKFSAKAPVYENARMLSHAGELLCFCDLKKLQWYEVGPPLPIARITVLPTGCLSPGH